jgi:hypothetical protein
MNNDKTSDRTSAFPAALAGLFGYGMKYFAYNFLTAVVLFCFGAMMFAYISFFGSTIPSWRLFSFLIPFNSNGTATIGTSDILWAYSLVSLVFMILATIAKGVTGGMHRRMHRMRGSSRVDISSPRNPQPIRKYFRAGMRRILIGSAVITLIFLTAFLAIPSAKIAEGTSRVTIFDMIGLFYGAAMVSNCVHVLIDSCSDFILDWAGSVFSWRMEWDRIA